MSVTAPLQAREGFLRHLEDGRQLSPNTLAAYRLDLEQFTSFLDDRFPADGWDWARVDRLVLRSFLGHLSRQGLARRTIARKLSAVRSFYRFLHRAGAVEANPARTIRTPKLERRLPSWLSRAEVHSCRPGPIEPVRAVQELDRVDGLHGQSARADTLGELHEASRDAGGDHVGAGPGQVVHLLGEHAPGLEQEDAVGHEERMLRIVAAEKEPDARRAKPPRHLHEVTRGERRIAAAVIAVFHDVLVTLGFFSMFQVEVSLNVIAALLTLVGFSVNDTIVVFDRIRENRRLHRRDTLYKITNDAINQTLSRTAITNGRQLNRIIKFLQATQSARATQ